MTLLVIAVTPLHARIGDDLHALHKILSKAALPTLIETEEPFIEKLSWRGKPGNTNSILLQELGHNLWEIKATAFVDPNKNSRTIIEMSYHKLVGGQINANEENQIVFHNSPPQQLLNISKPQKIPQHRPETIIIRYKQIDELFRLKDRQMVKFKNDWQCIGLNLNDLKKKFEGPVKVENGFHYFTRLDDRKNISWKIRVKLWQGPNDVEPITHRAVYERLTKFTPEEQLCMRLTNANANGTKWLELGQDVNKVNHFKTKAGHNPALRSWVKPLQLEVGVETLALVQAIPNIPNKP